MFLSPLSVARRWLAEALGLAVFVAFSLGAAALAQQGVLPELAAVALMPGLVILALVYGLSDLSGAHFNPAVTLAFALRGSFPWARVPGYLAAQLLETVCTALLLLVILATAKRKAEVGSQAGLVIAGTLSLCLLTAGSVSTIGVNPTRTLAAALFNGTVAASWPHLLGPLAGGALATGLTSLLRGPLNEQEKETAKGEEQPGEEEQEDRERVQLNPDARILKAPQTRTTAPDIRERWVREKGQRMHAEIKTILR